VFDVLSCGKGITIGNSSILDSIGGWGCSQQQQCHHCNTSKLDKATNNIGGINRSSVAGAMAACLGSSKLP
jgi:hypothetical protein